MTMSMSMSMCMTIVRAPSCDEKGRRVNRQPPILPRQPARQFHGAVCREDDPTHRLSRLTSVGVSLETIAVTVASAAPPALGFWPGTCRRCLCRQLAHRGAAASARTRSASIRFHRMLSNPCATHREKA